VSTPEFTVEYRAPAELSPHPLNFRRHPSPQKDALAASLREHSWLAAPIWNRRTGRLLDGHLRVEIAAADGQPAIPVRVIDVSEEQERRILASFDRIGSLALQDEQQLAALLQELAATEAGLPAGWEQGDLDALLEELGPPNVSFKEFDEESFQGIEDEWTEVKFRVPLGTVPVIEQQVERICAVCGFKEKAKGMALERLVQLAATVTDDELAG